MKARPNHFALPRTAARIVLFLLTLSLGALCPALVRAQIQASLPLEGYWRPGRYMPVRVVTQVDFSGGVARLRAEGAVDSDVALPPGASDVIVPLLMVTHSATQVAWDFHGASGVIAQPLHALDDEQTLVATDLLDSAAARRAYGHAHAIVIHLDPARPLLAPAAAWSGLDGVVLDAAAASRMTQRQLAALCAAGVKISIQSTQRPAGQWPWTQRNGFWTLAPQNDWPMNANESMAYLPASGWHVGWSARRRHVVVLIGLLIALSACGATLWRSRWTWAAIVMVSLAATGGVLAWWHRQSSMQVASGAVLVREGNLTQHDSWRYFSPVVPTEAALAWEDFTTPVFAGPRHLASLSIHLQCGNDGQPIAFLFRLTAGQLAFVTRSLQFGPPRAAESESVNTPLQQLESLYVGSDQVILGQSRPTASPDDATTIWPDLTVGPATK